MLVLHSRRINVGFVILFRYDDAKNKSRVQYCVELFTVGQSYRDSPRTSMLALLFAAVTSLNSVKSAADKNLNEWSVVWAVRMSRRLVMQWVQTSCGEGERGVKNVGKNDDRNEVLKSVEREAQTVAETAKMRVCAQQCTSEVHADDTWACGLGEDRL